MEKKIKAIIGFDTTQNERGKLDENYTRFKSIILEEGHEFFTDFEFPLSLGQLSKCDIIFFACPDRSKFREFEIEEIIKYVRNGGNVVLLSNAGGDKGLGTNLNDLGSSFGINCNNDQVIDEEHNYGIRTLPITQNFELHPITTDIELLLLPSTCSLTVSKDAVPIVMTDGDAEPPNMPVIAVSEKGLGKFIFMGTYEIFRDNIRGGIQVIQHRNLLKNILQFLTEDRSKSRIILNIQTILNAVTFKSKKKEKAKKISDKVDIASAPAIVKTPDGKISPESLLDQILTSLNQIKEITGNLNIINNNLTNYAREVQLLRSEISPIMEEILPLKESIAKNSELINTLKAEIQEIKLSKTLDEAVGSFKDFKNNFESQIDVILNKNLNPFKTEFNEIEQAIKNNHNEIKSLKKEIESLKKKTTKADDLKSLKDSIISEFEKLLKKSED